MSNFKEDSFPDELQERLGQSLKENVNTAAKDEPKSAYEACVLSEAAKVHDLIAKAQQEARERALNGE